jgi:hypothetical protein
MIHTSFREPFDPSAFVMDVDMDALDDPPGPPAPLPADPLPAAGGAPAATPIAATTATAGAGTAVVADAGLGTAAAAAAEVKVLTGAAAAAGGGSLLYPAPPSSGLEPLGLARGSSGLGDAMGDDEPPSGRREDGGQEPDMDFTLPVQREC